jgi:endonuclease/exonuclease/phosphatase family metal-dependent hydrolase
MCAASQLQLGVVYDPSRVRLVARRTQRELDPEARCSCRDGHPPALLAVLDAVEGGRLTAMSVHLQFGARRWQYRARRDQWDHLVASIARVEAEFGGNMVVAGDFNSTGFATDDGGEQAFMRARAAAAGLVLATADVGCTAYWRPNRRTRDYVPSTLDHVLTRRAPAEAPRAMGMCAALGGRMRPADAGNPDFHAVSDHCPLRWCVDV